LLPKQVPFISPPPLFPCRVNNSRWLAMTTITSQFQIFGQSKTKNVVLCTRYHLVIQPPHIQYLIQSSKHLWIPIALVRVSIWGNGSEPCLHGALPLVKYQGPKIVCNKVDF
jgi:hypothetical protein